MGGARRDPACGFLAVAQRPWEEARRDPACGYLAVPLRPGQRFSGKALGSPWVLLDADVCLVLAFCGVDSPSY